MKKKILRFIKKGGLLILLGVSFSTGCSWFAPGSAEDPGEAVGAPTLPETIREGDTLGSDYPEEGI